MVFAKVVVALGDGDTLIIIGLDCLRRSAQSTLAFAEALRGRGAGLGGVGTHTPVGSMVFTGMVALAQVEPEIKIERSTGSTANAGSPAGISVGGA